MKKSLFLAIIATSAIFVSCDLNADNKAVVTQAALETPKGKHSYAVGTDFGKAIKQIKADLDYAILVQGIKDQLDTTKPALMNDSQVMVALQDLMQEMEKQKHEAERQKAQENLTSQKTFLEKNKNEVGVVTTPSGLQYMVIAEGSGEKAKDGNVISVHYTGTLLNGTKFDSSIDRNQPLSIELGEGRLIPGWVEMLRLMKKGDKVKAWIPSELGYGENGNHAIPGGSLLIFDMELLDIQAAK
jgi:FKBP-type peptidyl-prolyl cis-trans isomerase